MATTPTSPRLRGEVDPERSEGAGEGPGDWPRRGKNRVECRQNILG
jgi:hypothetical protein